MPAKPTDIYATTLHTYWDSNDGFTCSLCGSHLLHEYNNG